MDPLQGGGTLSEVGDSEQEQRDEHSNVSQTAAQAPSKLGATANGSLALEATPSMLLLAPDMTLPSHISRERSHSAAQLPVNGGYQQADGAASSKHAAAANGDAHRRAEAATQQAEQPAEERRDPLSESLRSLASAISDASEQASLPPPPELSDSFSERWRAEEQRVSASSAASEQEQVSFHDLARAPALARAARTELYDRQHSGVIETAGGDAIEFGAHAAEVERQHAAWLAVDTDAKNEARVNKELADLLCRRLDASRKAAQKVLGVLQALASAEAAYSLALARVSKIDMRGEADGASLTAALRAFATLPAAVGSQHDHARNLI